MNKEYVYLIAEKLYLNAAKEPLCNRNWLFAIYKALLIANEGDTETIKWTQYNQWKIDHNCRAAKTTAKANNSYIIDFNLTLNDENTAKIKVVFNKKGVTTKPIECIYNARSFINEMWEVKNPNNESILLSAFERDRLYNASVQNIEPIAAQVIEAFIQVKPSVQDQTQPDNTIIPDTYKKTKKKMNDEQVRDMKFVALNVLLNQIRETYNQIEDSNQKSYLEVVIGAAIFYLPTLNSHFNGFISINALKGYLKNERRVKDHIYPRKLAAKTLLKNPLSLDALKKQYHDELAKFMYITSSENSILVNYYEEYVDHDQAMEAFQIVKFPTSNEEKFISHNELDKFILFLGGKNVQGKNKEELMELLQEFRINNLN
jgi:hypothetical protein